jgi:hypothetical protein
MRSAVAESSKRRIFFFADMGRAAAPLHQATHAARSSP